MRLTRRFIIQSLNNVNVSSPIRYERYYINNNLRIQSKNNIFEKEILNKENVIIEKTNISEDEFNQLKKDAYSKIIRDSYLYLDDNRISIKKYLGQYKGLIRVEVKFNSIDEMHSYKKESWMGTEITNSTLAFDKHLSKLSEQEFLLELNKYIKEWYKWKIDKIRQTLTVWLRFIETPLEKPINKGIEEILILHDFNKKSSKITKKW